MTPRKPMTEPELLEEKARLFEELKDVLLREDRAAFRRLENILDNPDELKHKMSPVLEDRLQQLKVQFPEEYRSIVERMISEKLANSKEELLEAIYPIMGKLIKRYIAYQFELLREQIRRKTQWNWRNKLSRRIRALFTGVAEDEAILAEFQDYSIEDVFIIQKNSGLLIASANKDADDDIIAGMVTAIKAFAEDAFRRPNAELERINYDDLILLFEAFYSYYFVVVIKGNITAATHQTIHEKMNNFAARELTHGKVRDGQFSLALSIKLKSEFFDNQEK